jgi:hypothetical protein
MACRESDGDGDGLADRFGRMMLASGFSAISSSKAVARFGSYRPPLKVTLGRHSVVMVGAGPPSTSFLAAIGDDVDGRPPAFAGACFAHHDAEGQAGESTSTRIGIVRIFHQSGAIVGRVVVAIGPLATLPSPKCSSRTINRASVVFPKPLSPTTPNVSPAR